MKVLAGRLVLGLSVVATLAGCGDPTAPGNSGGSSSSYDGSWRLVEGQGPEGPVPLVDGYRITLDLRDDQAQGTAACNSYGGEVEIDEGDFAMPQWSVTEMACRADVMNSEAAYLAALQNADSIARAEDELTLSGDDTELRYELVPPVPTADLIDTRWKLESLVHGKGLDSMSQGAAAPADLVLRSDGTLIGSTGCRELYGEWTERGDEIHLSSFGAEGQCSARHRDQDDHVVNVIGDGFTVEIEENRLTVFSRGNLGVSYLASDLFEPSASPGVRPMT